MALDTRSKRASSVGMLLGFCVLAPPEPDGSVIVLSAADRKHAAWAYSGLSAGDVLPEPAAQVIELEASVPVYNLRATV